MSSSVAGVNEERCRRIPSLGGREQDARKREIERKIKGLHPRRETVNELTRSPPPPFPQQLSSVCVCVCVCVCVPIFHYLTYSLLPCGRSDHQCKDFIFNFQSSLSLPLSLSFAMETVLTNFITVLRSPLPLLHDSSPASKWIPNIPHSRPIYLSSNGSENFIGTCSL